MKVKDFRKRLKIERMNVVYKKQILNEDMTLHSYGIKNEDTIVIK